MVDPLSVTIGIGVSLVIIAAALGLYYMGQRPAYMVDMREVSNYYRHVSANEALADDVDQSEGE